MLWGLLLVLIPIILHLFNFRRFKTVYFSNVNLLKEIKEESKKSRTLKNWLILLFRVLFITFLVLAFAFPIKGDIQLKEDEIIGIYIDNSFSMDTDGIEGNKLDNAKAYADQVINSLPPNTKIHLTTNEFKGDHQIALNKTKAQEEVSKILPSPKSRSFSNIYKRQSLFFKNNGKTNLYWMSDFQQLTDSSFSGIENYKVQLGLLKSIEGANISLDSVWFDAPVRKKIGLEKINIKISNHGKEVYKDFNVKLKINERLNQLNIPELQPGLSEHSLEFQIPNDSIILGLVSIEDGFQAFDNQLSFSYLIPNQQNVHLITGTSNSSKKIIKRIFANDSSINLSISSPLDINYSELAKKDFIILGELNSMPQTLINELFELSKKGKSIAVIPGSKIDFDNYNNSSALWGGTKFNKKDTSAIEIGSISKKHAFFSGVFEEQKIKDNIKESFPKLFNRYEISSSENSTTLIYLENGAPYLNTFNNFYIFASGITPSQSNISQKAIIVPIFYQILFNALNTTPIQYFIEPVIEIQTSASNQKTIQLNKNEYSAQLRINNNTAQLPNDIGTGDYILSANRKTIGAFSLNYNRIESKKVDKQLDLLKELEKRNEFSQIEISGNKNSNLSRIADKEGSLWLTCLVLAIGFLTLEMIFIRIKS